MRTVKEGLVTPYAGQATHAALEQLRKAVLAAVYPTGADTTKTARVYAWALRSDLRSYFPGAPQGDNAFADGPSTTESAAVLDAKVPTIAALRAALPYANVTPAVLDTLRPYLQNQLPQRRLEGYCALACICALRRSNE